MRNKDDPFAAWIINLGAIAASSALAHGSMYYGIERYELRESVALNNPAYVQMVAGYVQERMGRSNFHPDGVAVEMTPLKDAGMYGALIQVVDPNNHKAWAQTMKAER